MSATTETLMIEQLGVKWALANAFRSKVSTETSAKVIAVIELAAGRVMLYTIEGTKEELEKCAEFALHTWFKNPVFQRHYHGVYEYEQIAETYLAEAGERLSK